MLLFASCLVTSSAFPLLGPTPALPQFHPEWQLDRLDSGRSIGLTRYQEPPKWMNPCGGVVVDADSSSPSDTKIAAYAILDVQLALNYVHQFKDRFVSLPFHASSIKFISLSPVFYTRSYTRGIVSRMFPSCETTFQIVQTLEESLASLSIPSSATLSGISETLFQNWFTTTKNLNIVNSNHLVPQLVTRFNYNFTSSSPFHFYNLVQRN